MVPLSMTRQYQPVMPRSATSCSAFSRPKRALIFQQGLRGCVTCTRAAPMRKMSPTHTLSSLQPVVDTFSPMLPGTNASALAGKAARSTA